MKKDIDSIIGKLKNMHGQPRCEPPLFQRPRAVVATVLSAQCTDERVNRVTEQLFKKYRSLQDYIDAAAEELEEDVRPTGFYRNKAKSIKNIAAEIAQRFKEGPRRHRRLCHREGYRPQVRQHDRRPCLR